MELRIYSVTPISSDKISCYAKEFLIAVSLLEAHHGQDVNQTFPATDAGSPLHKVALLGFCVVHTFDATTINQTDLMI